MSLKRVWGPVALVAAVSFIVVPAANAVAPLNDLPTGAQALPDGPYPVLSTTVDTLDATTASDPPANSCQANVSRSVWYRFTPGTTSHYRLTTALGDGPTATTLSNTVLAIYTSTGGAAGPFTELPTDVVADTDGCDDDSAINGVDQSTIHTRLTAGTEYWAVVWQFDTPPPFLGEDDVQLRIDRNPSPANDKATGAIDLQLNAPRSGTYLAAFNDYTLNDPGCFPPLSGVTSAHGRDLVYRFTAPSTGSYAFRLAQTNTQSFSGVLYVADSLPSPSPTPQDVTTCLGAAEAKSAVFSSEEVSPLSLTANQTVFVVVDQASPNVDGAFRVVAERSVSESESNDTPATASPTSCGMRGAISPSGDVDFFSLGSPAAGSRIFALADAAASSVDDLSMRVTAAADTLEFDDNDAVDRFGTLAPLIAGTSATGAPTFLRINAGPGAAEPYRLYSAVQPAAASATLEGAEPNGTPAQATPAPNLYARGSLLHDADQDAFAVELPARTLIFAGLDLDPSRDNTTWNGRLTLIGPDGTSLVDVNNVNSAASNASGAGSLTATTPHTAGEGLVFRTDEAGTYYLRVGTNPPSTFGDYLLSISAECTAGALPKATVDPTPDPGDSTAPETTIDKGPKKKSAKRKAKFEFSSSEPGSTFECALDKAGFAPCTSPLKTKKLKPGKHKFSVRAKDAAGNLDATPATQSFKVKRKKRA